MCDNISFFILFVAFLLNVLYNLYVNIGNDRIGFYMDDLLVKIITSLGVGLIAGLPVAWLLKVLYNSFIAPFR